MELLDLIVLAAGDGSRTADPRPKQFLDLGGKPVLVHSLSTFEQLPYVGVKYVTVRHEDLAFVEEILVQHHITNFKLVPGGSTRQESVRLALEHVSSERVITHNAALPFVTQELISNVVRERDPCVTTVTPVPYSLCRGGDFAETMILPDRLKVINTPQSFHANVLRECHRRAHQGQLRVRSDCELMLHYGYPVRFVEGNLKNFKITTQLDLILARALVQESV